MRHSVSTGSLCFFSSENGIEEERRRRRRRRRRRVWHLVELGEEAMHA